MLPGTAWLIGLPEPPFAPVMLITLVADAGAVCAYDTTDTSNAPTMVVRVNSSARFVNIVTGRPARSGPSPSGQARKPDPVRFPGPLRSPPLVARHPVVSTGPAWPFLRSRCRPSSLCEELPASRVRPGESHDTSRWVRTRRDMGLAAMTRARPTGRIRRLAGEDRKALLRRMPGVSLQ